ncbi:YggT family protein [Sulfurospirillum sp. UCH001]|jgi:YggT family protein|uniref:YggT family protein n=1 Tax=Sulfurospirillum sp. UCH001 TaxID=1581011 RepID=UPI0009E7CDF7|nr:YggT family protein [Sulfurospirillum sp. 'SP']
MIVLATLIEAFATILHTLINIYIWVVIIAALITFVRPDPYNPIVQILFRLTNPVYAFIRRLVPTLIGGIDLAPLIVILTLQFIDLFAVKLLFALANAL